MGLVAKGCSRCQDVPDSTYPQMESRRITHISAEQKRRFNIKLGFNTLHSLVSTLSAQPSIKVSAQGCADWAATGTQGHGVSPGDATSLVYPSAQGSCPAPQSMGHEAASPHQAHGDPCSAVVPGWSGLWSLWQKLPRLGSGEHGTSCCQPHCTKCRVPHALPTPGAPFTVSSCGPIGQQGHHLAEDS